MTKKLCFLPICFLLLLTKTALAQTELVSPKSAFKNEIGLDFAPFVNGDRGVSLLYIRQIGPVKVKKWQKQSALRLVAGYYKDPIHPNNFDFLQPNPSFKTIYEPYDANRHFASVGYERQLDRHSFRFYYGGEVGYRGGNGQSVSHEDSIVNGVNKVQSVRNSKWTAKGPEAAVFSGVNYFFLPHFSIGLEIHISYGIEFYNSESVRDNQAPYQYDNTTFIGTTDLLHFLYVSYHF